MQAIFIYADHGLRVSMARGIAVRCSQRPLGHIRGVPRPPSQSNVTGCSCGSLSCGGLGGGLEVQSCSLLTCSSDKTLHHHRWHEYRYHFFLQGELCYSARPGVRPCLRNTRKTIYGAFQVLHSTSFPCVSQSGSRMVSPPVSGS